MECPVRACTHCQHSTGLQGWYRIASMADGGSASLGPLSTSGCFFFLYCLHRLTLEKGPVTVGKDPLTIGKVLLTVGKTTTWDPLMRAYKTILRKLGFVWSSTVFICLRVGAALSVGCAQQLEGCVFCRWALQSWNRGWYTHGDTSFKAVTSYILWAFLSVLRSSYVLVTDRRTPSAFSLLFVLIRLELSALSEQIIVSLGLIGAYKKNCLLLPSR